jgi:hypothetical protein
MQVWLASRGAEGDWGVFLGEDAGLGDQIIVVIEQGKTGAIASSLVPSLVFVCSMCRTFRVLVMLWL